MGVNLVEKKAHLVIQKDMLKGDDGGYYIPSVDEDGNLTWTPSQDDMWAVEGANIKGAKGDKGDKGDPGEKGADGTMSFEDLTEEQKATLKGDKGDKGDTGEKGDAFTYDDFTDEQLAALKGEKGDKGDKGDTGAQGEQGVAGADGKDGTNGADGYTPVRGTDYWTEEDKAVIVAATIAALPVYDGEVV